MQSAHIPVICEINLSIFWILSRDDITNIVESIPSPIARKLRICYQNLIVYQLMHILCVQEYVQDWSNMMCICSSGSIHFYTS
jgi:hypothetical protein